jgi:hypothetical protein
MVDMIDTIYAIDTRCRMKRKGIMSAMALFMMMGAFLIAHVLMVSNIRNRSLISGSLIADRIYYIYESIESSAARIIEIELGNSSKPLTMNVTVDEQPDYSYVTFTERLPQNVSGFNDDLARYERFAESYLNWTDIDVSTGISGLGGDMESVIEPYGITYTHVGPWGNGDKRQYEVIPGSGLGNLNGYTITVQLENGWRVVPSSATWGPLKAGDLLVNITTISSGGSPVHSTQQYVSRTDKSTFKVDTNKTAGGYVEGWVRAIVSDEYDGGVLFEMHLTEAVVSTKLDLDDVPGETTVELPDGKINVVETQYNIEKNGTVGI